MTASMSLKLRWMMFGLVALCLVLMSGVDGQVRALALINESPSLPRGLYLRGSGEPEVGSIVALPQPVSSRAYLKSLGMPGDVLLIKRVAARGGDMVCREGLAVRTPARRVEAHDQDNRGTTLPVWSGCRRLAEDQFFLLGDTPGSFDSRYFGTVDRAEITGIYRGVLTW